MDEKFDSNDNLIQVYKEILKAKDKWIKFLAGTLIVILIGLIILLGID